MKNIAILALSLCCSQLFSQQDKTLSYGIQWGFHGNQSTYSGGMEQAHSRFQANPHGSVALDFIARFDVNNRWMVTSGLGFSNYGFEFALTENYSLIQNKRKYSVIRSDFGVVNLPFLVYYKFNPTCNGKRWLIGGGFVLSATERKGDIQSFATGTEGNTNFKYLNSESSSAGLGTTMLRFTVGREKTSRCGGLLHAAFILNVGFSELAKAKVTYTVEGQEYNHEFVNRGNFVGFRFAYFFKAGRQTFGQ